MEIYRIFDRINMIINDPIFWSIFFQIETK